MCRSVDQQISRFGTFNEVIIDRQLNNSIQTVFVEFGNNRLIIDIPTITQHLLQHGHLQTIQIGKRTLHINLPVALNYLLSANFPMHPINEHTILVDATALIGIPKPDHSTESCPQEDAQFGFPDLCLAMESLFISADNLLCKFVYLNSIPFYFKTYLNHSDFNNIFSASFG